MITRFIVINVSEYIGNLFKANSIMETITAVRKYTKIVLNKKCDILYETCPWNIPWKEYKLTKIKESTKRKIILKVGSVLLSSQDSSEKAIGTERAAAPTVTCIISSKLIYLLLIAKSHGELKDNNRN